MCLAMFASCENEVNNDPLAQPSEPQTEKKEPSMSILEIDKMPEDTTPKQLMLAGYDFYRKTIDRAGETKYNDTFYKVIHSKEEFDALFADVKGSYDDTVCCPGSTSTDTFESISKKFGTNEFFESNCLMVVIKYSDNYALDISGDLYLTHDKKLLFSGDVGMLGEPSNSPGYYCEAWPIEHTLFSKNGIKLNSEIEIDIPIKD